MNDKSKAITLGIAIPSVVALLVLLLTSLLFKHDEHAAGELSAAEFVVLPICMGLIASYFLVKVTDGWVKYLGYSTILTMIGLLLSAIFMGEGIVCLIIVSPLILAFVFIGMLLGKLLFKKNNTTLKVSTFFILVFAFFYDTMIAHDYSNSVTDEMVINAPVSEVWKYVAEHPLNTEEPDYWLFKAGLPNPVQSTVTKNCLGGERKCVFSNNATFDEVITEWKKDSVFTFDIVKQPADPEIIGHIQIERGKFILKDNGNGTTTLIGISWYKLFVFPSWYYDRWAIDITRNVHLRVMKHIKTLAEKDV